VVSKPAATFAKTGDGPDGNARNDFDLSVDLVPAPPWNSHRSEHAVHYGCRLAFSRIRDDDSSGVAAVVLTLPSECGDGGMYARGRMVSAIRLPRSQKHRSSVRPGR